MGPADILPLAEEVEHRSDASPGSIDSGAFRAWLWPS